jgi:hypothetical protein
LDLWKNKAKKKQKLNNDYEVQGIVKPGSTMESLINTSSSDIRKLTDSDVCLIWGGTHDVGKNESKKGSTALKECVKKYNHMNIIAVNVPHRYDLQAACCVNHCVNN